MGREHFLVIYGEEIIPVKFNGGLYDSLDASNPKSYTRELKNMVVTDKETLAVRYALKSLALGGTVGQNYAANALGTGSFTGMVPFVKQVYDRIIPLGGYSATLPTAVVATDGVVGAITLYAYNPSGSASVAATVAQTYTWETAVMYRDRIYVYDYTVGQYYRLTGWVFGTPGALTETAIATSAAMTIAPTQTIFHKDRLFAICGNRVYFTNVITVGGYPETWDVANNFFDIPSDSRPIIHHCVVIQNIMYFFTEDGIYILQVYGLPTSWFVQKIKLPYAFPTAPTDICSNQGTVYFTDRNSIYEFQGNARRITLPREIGQPIKNIIQGLVPNSASNGTGMGIGLVPFEQGFLVTIQALTQTLILTLPNRYRTYVSSSRVFYYDGNGHWSEMTLKNEPLFGVGYSVPHLKVPTFYANQPTSFFSAIHGDANTSCRVELMLYKKGDFSGDNYTVVGTADTTDTIEPSVKFAAVEGEGVKKYGEVYWKEGYLDVYTKLTSFFKQDTLVNETVAAEETYTPSPTRTDASYIQKLKGPGGDSAKMRSFQTNIRASVPTSNTDARPPFEIRELVWVANSDEGPEKDFTSG